MDKTTVKPKKKRRSLKHDVNVFFAGVIRDAMDSEGFWLAMQELGWEPKEAQRIEDAAHAVIERLTRT